MISEGVNSIFLKAHGNPQSFVLEGIEVEGVNSKEGLQERLTPSD